MELTTCCKYNFEVLTGCHAFLSGCVFKEIKIIMVENKKIFYEIQKEALHVERKPREVAQYEVQRETLAL